jgi:hypothetical protein
MLFIVVLAVVALVAIAAGAVHGLNTLQNRGDDRRLAVVSAREHRAPYAPVSQAAK